MIYTGATLVVRKKFSAKHFWTDSAKYNCTMVCTIGELNRYVLAQPTDTQHKVRLIITAGLRKELWLEFQKRFEVDHIIEFYTSTEGNFGIINIDNKPGSVGALPLFVPSLQNVTILKLHPETSDYLRDENDFCVECGVSEPGETVCEITKVSPFYGYRNKENSAKNS
ncbi:long-chain fatty acid transport protein 2-like isoform X3 [Halichondria panicea]|uniref:long-chain fatty acid transport protein 2-like isoform X3 n=1 Tax=Halichondria panicea TaxID=6063 RepID=UPI00312BBF23